MKADAPSLLFVRMRLTQRWYQRGARNTPLIKAGSNTGQPAAATQAMHPLPPRFKNERVIDGPVSQITTPCLTLTAMAGPWPGIAVGFSVSQASTASPCIECQGWWQHRRVYGGDGTVGAVLVRSAQLFPACQSGRKWLEGVLAAGAPAAEQGAGQV